MYLTLIYDLPILFNIDLINQNNYIIFNYHRRFFFLKKINELKIKKYVDLKESILNNYYIVYAGPSLRYQRVELHRSNDNNHE